MELFTPDNETTIMAIYDVQVSHKGSNLQYTDPDIVYESKDEDNEAGRVRKCICLVEQMSNLKNAKLCRDKQHTTELSLTSLH